MVWSTCTAWAPFANHLLHVRQATIGKWLTSGPAVKKEPRHQILKDFHAWAHALAKKTSKIIEETLKPRISACIGRLSPSLSGTMRESAAESHKNISLKVNIKAPQECSTRLWPDLLKLQFRSEPISACSPFHFQKASDPQRTCQNSCLFCTMHRS